MSGRYAFEDGPLGGESLGRTQDRLERIQGSASVTLSPAEATTLRLSTSYANTSLETYFRNNETRSPTTVAMLLSKPELANCSASSADASTTFGSSTPVCTGAGNPTGALTFAGVPTVRELMQPQEGQDARHFTGSVNLAWGRGTWPFGPGRRGNRPGRRRLGALLARRLERGRLHGRGRLPRWGACARPAHPPGRHGRREARVDCSARRCFHIGARGRRTVVFLFVGSPLHDRPGISGPRNQGRSVRRGGGLVHRDHREGEPGWIPAGAGGIRRLDFCDGRRATRPHERLRQGGRPGLLSQGGDIGPGQ